MKEVYVLRHAEKSGDDLTVKGRAQAVALAKRTGFFKAAISSESNRTKQTAELVSGEDCRIDMRANVPNFPESKMASLQEIQKIHPLGIVGAIWEDDELIEAARIAGMTMKDLVFESLSDLSENEKALIVSHDGTMIALQKILNHETFDAVDHSFGPLEGFIVSEDLATRTFNPRKD